MSTLNLYHSSFLADNCPSCQSFLSSLLDWFLLGFTFYIPLLSIIMANPEVLKDNVGAQRSLCSYQHWGNLRCQHADLFLQRGSVSTCCPHTRLAADVVSSLVTYMLSVAENTLDPPWDPFVSLSLYGPIFMEGITCTLIYRTHFYGKCLYEEFRCSYALRFIVHRRLS